MIRHVLVCSPDPHYIHHQAFFDIALSFSRSLKELGHPAEPTVDPTGLTGTTLVFGAHLIPHFKGSITGGDYILFNTEQYTPASPWFTPGYIDILSRYPVWDYSEDNLSELENRHGIRGRHCEIGYHPCMGNIALGRSVTLTGGGRNALALDYAPWSAPSSVVQPFDILFYGTPHPRRQRVIDALRAAGKTVISLNGYGAYRDKYIAAARLVLNMHYYDSALFEIVRVSHLLANGKCVVSETGNETALEEPYRDAVAFADYDMLGARCLKLLGDADARGALAARAVCAIQARPQAAILKGLLA